MGLMILIIAILVNFLATNWASKHGTTFLTNGVIGMRSILKTVYGFLYFILSYWCVVS